MERLWYFCLAIILNSIGHSMTIVTNMGSMPWPASIVNIMHTLGWTMTATIFTEGIAVMVIDALISREIDWRRWLRELIFLVPYSILMQYFAGWWRHFGIDQLSLAFRLGFDILGLLSAFIGLAIYQKVGIIHPHDELSVTLKERFNTRFKQSFNIILPVLIIIFCGLHNHTFYAVNIGTVLGMICQGTVVDWFNRRIPIKIK